MVELPFSGFPKESMDVTLDGRLVRVRVSFNSLVETWSLGVIDLSGNEPVDILTGVVVALGADLFAPYALGLGGLFAEATTRPLDDAKRGELGSRVKLIHYTAEELAAK